MFIHVDILFRDFLYCALVKPTPFHTPNFFASLDHHPRDLHRLLPHIDGGVGQCLAGQRCHIIRMLDGDTVTLTAKCRDDARDRAETKTKRGGKDGQDTVGWGHEQHQQQGGGRWLAKTGAHGLSAAGRRVMTSEDGGAQFVGDSWAYSN